jgi:hypothetical protein
MLARMAQPLDEIACPVCHGDLAAVGDRRRCAAG